MLRKFKARKLGQNFLVSKDIAAAEAEHAHGKVVLEIGPGRGMLTRELCSRAKKVIAVEKDELLCGEIKRGMNFDNLVLVNRDFLKLDGSEFDAGEVEIVIANIPYNISSEVVSWLSEKGKEAVLCLQKEFVASMVARPGTREYSKLSVFSSLSFSITEIMDVPRGNFSPAPSVDSEIIYMKPRQGRPGKGEWGVIGALMQHKKKTLRNALLDSRAYFGAGKDGMSALADKIGDQGRRVFTLAPEELLRISEEILRFRR